MTLDSVRNTAEAVEMLAADMEVVFEVHTREHWLNQYADKFADLKHTHLSCEELDADDYRTWMQEADLLLLAYNFDERSTRYVWLSMANKLPELMASGRPVVAIGPRGLATLDWMEDRNIGIRVSEPGFHAIAEALRPVINDPIARSEMANHARAVVFDEKNLHTVRADFQSRLRDGARTRSTPQGRYDPEGIESYLRSLLVPEVSETELEPSDGTQNRPRQQSQNVQPLPAEPVARPGGLARVKRIVGFYLSWRGILALLSITVFALPLRNWSVSDPVLSQIEMWSTPAALGLVFFFLGYLYTLVSDHYEITEQRIRRINHRLNRRK